MRYIASILTLLVACTLGCEKKKRVPNVAIADPDRPNIEAEPIVGPGKKVLETYECRRCHVIEGIEPTTVNMDCRGCHRAIITRTYPEPEEYLEMWDRGLENMRDVPSLVATADRFRRGWFVEFVTKPHDLRPRLGAEMPNLAITQEEAAQIADSLGLVDGDAAELAGNADRGRELAQSKGCGSCHVMTGLEGGLKASAIPVDVPADRLQRAMTLAPDLAETRDRFRGDQLVGWLQDPVATKADTLMPKIPLTGAEATDIATFILSAPLTTPPANVPAAARPAALDREVRWKEVQTKLIDEICLHCHSDPKYNEGDGGPGNTGGFGWPGKKLDFSTYERAVYGADGDGEKPLYIYQPLVNGTPRVVAHLLERQREVNGADDKALLGMPLGFPPIDEKRIQLLDTWIRQGMKE